MLKVLAGPFLWTKALFIFSCLGGAGIFFTALFTVLYQRWIYTKYLRKKYDPLFQPRCSILVPCKGTGKNFRRNLRSFLSLDYRDYEVVFSVESEQDESLPIIKSVTQDNPRAFVVVAGLSTSCAQKNHNHLAAIRAAHSPEVYVFADADISPRPSWLSEIVRPLSDPGIAVATGFRWLTVERGTLAHQVHFFMNSFLYTLYSAASFFGSVGLWGGTMAMRRKDFEALGVASRWSETAVDDSSLSQLIKKNSRRSILVPTCITQTNDMIPSVREAMRWFERQMMFLKAYQKSLWCVAIPPIVVAFLLIVWLPVSALLSMVTAAPFISLGGVASLVMVGGMFCADLLYPLMGAMPRLGSFIVFQPVAWSAFLLSCIRTAFTNTITWSSIRYHVSFSGRVTGIERLEAGPPAQGRDA
jgi:ceramide glucosyltransferase